MSSVVKFFVPPVMVQDIYPTFNFGQAEFRINVFNQQAFDVEIVRLADFNDQQTLVLSQDQDKKIEENHELKDHVSFGSYYLAETTMGSLRALQFVKMLKDQGIPAWTDAVSDFDYTEAEEAGLNVDHGYIVELVDFNSEIGLWCDVFPRFKTVRYRSFKTNSKMYESVTHLEVSGYNLKWFDTE